MPQTPHGSSVSLEALLSAIEDAAPDGGDRPMLLIECGESTFAIDASVVESIDEAGVIAPLPYPPASVVGVASVRGSMRLVVSLVPHDPRGRGRLVALSSDRNVAILADRVLGVFSSEAGAGAAGGEPDGRTRDLQFDGRTVTLIDHASVIGS